VPSSSRITEKHGLCMITAIGKLKVAKYPASTRFAPPPPKVAAIELLYGFLASHQQSGEHKRSTWVFMLPGSLQGLLTDSRIPFMPQWRIVALTLFAFYFSGCGSL